MSNVNYLLNGTKTRLLRSVMGCVLAFVAVSGWAANFPGLVGDYYSNMALSGTPQTQVDATVNFNWGSGVPRAGIGADNFSVRWTGFLRTSSSNNYRFQTVSDDGVRLWVNGVQVINNWTNHAAATDTTGNINLGANQVVPIVLEYYENTGSAVMQLQWNSGSGNSYVAIPGATTDGVAGLFFKAPAVTSINRVNPSPTEGSATVAWTVVFDSSVTGVNDLDFTLVQSGGMSGATIASVSGSGTTWTVTANVGSGTGNLGLNLIDDDSIVDGSGGKLGGPGVGNGNFTTGEVYEVSAASQPFCSQPTGAGIPAGLTCVCDQFNRTTGLNPSTIFGSNWIPSTSDTTGIVPSIVAGRLRLTDKTGDNAKAATVPGIFPAAGNYISVEFQQYAYGGSGADGIAVTLSDYAVPAVPGAFGGSLGYAQKTGSACGKAGGCPGFAGGWIGIGLDEFGNYSNESEGRVGGAGTNPQWVGVRGSGSADTGYNWVRGSLAAPIDSSLSTPSPGNYYQIIVDARGYTAQNKTTLVQVNRDTGSGYNNVVPSFNIYQQNPSQVVVPNNWQISFTGSTGGSTNIHEIGNVRICAQTVYPPGGGSASGFNAIDEAYGNPATAPVPVQNYQTGHIYTKLMGEPFKLDVAALDKNNQIQTTYASSGTKTVTVKLVDNSDNACVLDSTKPGYCSSSCQSKAAVAAQTLSFAPGDKGQKQSASFTVNSAYRNLAAIISDTTPVTACATDVFSVRPTGLNVSATTASGTGIAGTPVFKAGSGQFSLTASVSGIANSNNGYTGVLKVNSDAIQAVSPATRPGALVGTFPPASSSTPWATVTGTAFTYDEVGVAQLNGYAPALEGTRLRAIYDGVASARECTPSNPAACDLLRGASWTGVDGISARNDCISDSYSNTKAPAGQTDAGKYGCNFGLLSPVMIGRFVPDHFEVSLVGLRNRSDLSCGSASTFTYMDEPMQATFTLTAKNAGGSVTLNYEDNPSPGSGLAKLNLAAPANFNLGAVDGTSLTTRLAGLNSSGVGSNWAQGVANVQLGFVLARAAAPGGPDGPFAPKFGIAPTDGDGVTLRLVDFNLDTNTPATSNNHFTIGSTPVRFGRLKLANAFGSEKLNLPIPVEAQYWNGVAFITNIDDSCSPLANANAVLGNYSGGLSASNMGNGHVSGLGTLNQGKAALMLTKPDSMVVGGVDLVIKLGNDTSADASCPTPLVPGNAGIAGANLSYLRGQWCGTNSARDPRAHSRFGVYKNPSQMIYLREMY